MKYCVLVFVNNENSLASCLDAVIRQTNDLIPIYVYGKSDYSHLQTNVTRVKFFSLKTTNSNPYSVAFKEILKEDYDWVWCIQSNCVPNKDALLYLTKAAKTAPKAGYFVSLTKHNGENVFTPLISSFKIDDEPRWAELAPAGLIRISSAEMNSVFLSTKAIRLLGHPAAASIGETRKYLSSVSEKVGAGYYAPKSIVNAETIPEVKKASLPIAQPTIKVCAVIVTYNRKQLLTECLDALLKQTYSAFDILIVDNASTDGTFDTIAPYLSDRIKYCNTESNLGGAGGFYYGMKRAYEQNYDWIWIMDDDVIPSPTALAELIAPTKTIKNVSFFASTVYSPNGQAMNTPEISKFSTNGYRFWYAYLDRGLVRLAHATFVSLLINRNAIAKCGLPCKDYFIWGDDTEYTMRIIGKYGAAYLVGKSRVVHKRENSSSLRIHNETNPNRIKMYYYMVRNTLLNAKTYFGKNSYKNFLKQYIKDCLWIATHKGVHRGLKVKTILKAIIDFKKKHYDAVAFENRSAVYGQEKIVATILGDQIPDARDPFYTIRTIPFSLFAKGGFVDNAVRCYLLNDEAIESQNTQLKMLAPIYKADKLIIDIDSTAKPIYRIAYGDSLFYLNETAVFTCPTEEIPGISIQKVAPCDLAETEIEDSIVEFLQTILTRYHQENIVIVKPQNKQNEFCFSLFKEKLPYATVVEAVEDAIQ